MRFVFLMANPTGQSGVAGFGSGQFPCEVSFGPPPVLRCCTVGKRIPIMLKIKWLAEFSLWPQGTKVQSCMLFERSETSRLFAGIYDCAHSSRVPFERWHVVGRHQVSRIHHPASSVAHRELTVADQLFLLRLVGTSVL